MSPPQSEISQLITAARAGDVSARDALFERCRNYVNVIARTQIESWLRKKVDASDLVQQTLLEAYEDFSKFEGADEGEWLAWLKQILAHNAQDVIRKYRTAKRDAYREQALNTANQNQSAFEIDLSDAMPTPSQVIIKQEQQIELANAITQLSPDHQEVIHLRNLLRLPFDEVAERMGRTRPAVQMLWMRALKKLEEILAHSDGSSHGDDRAHGAKS